MKRTWLLLAALVVAPSLAHAQGAIALRWNLCYGNSGVSNKTFACNTNTGTSVFVASAVPGVAMPSFNGYSANIYIMTIGPALPSWWLLQTGGCRAGALTQSLAPSGVGCTDPWLGGGFGSLSYTANYLATYRARVQLIGTRLTTTPLAASTEYFLVRLILSNVKTTGTGSCAGCASPMCLGLVNVLLTQTAGVGDVALSQPFPATDSDAITWQTGAVMTRSSPGGVKDFACVAETDLKTPTWGAIKRMYR